MVYLDLPNFCCSDDGLARKNKIKASAVKNNIIQAQIAKKHAFTLQDELKFNFNSNEKYKNRNKTNKSSLPFL